MNTAAKRRYISPAEAAKELGLSTSSIYRAIDGGHLPAVRLRPLGSLRIPVDALQPGWRPDQVEPDE